MIIISGAAVILWLQLSFIFSHSKREVMMPRESPADPLLLSFSFFFSLRKKRKMPMKGGHEKKRKRERERERGEREREKERVMPLLDHPPAKARRRGARTHAHPFPPEQISGLFSSRGKLWVPLLFFGLAFATRTHAFSDVAVMPGFWSAILAAWGPQLSLMFCKTWYESLLEGHEEEGFSVYARQWQWEGFGSLGGQGS